MQSDLPAIAPSTDSATRVRQLLNELLTSPDTLLKLDAADADFALRLLRRARLQGYIAASLRNSDRWQDLPKAAREQLESALVNAASRRRLARWELNRIAWALKDRPEIPLVLVKGCAYDCLNLPNAAGRIFADVDVLTSEAELPVVEASLNERGWYTDELSPYDQNYYRNWTHELPPLIHQEREVEIDLHHNILPRTSRLTPPANRLLAAAVPAGDARYAVLQDEDIVLHTMTHLMFDGDLSDKLRDLVDVRVLLDYFSGQREHFWAQLQDRASELDLQRPLYYSLRYVHRLLGCPVPGEVMARNSKNAPVRPVIWLMDYLVPRALYPLPLSGTSSTAKLSRLLLFIRSHWIRMPPWLLFYHLSYKFFVTRLQGRKRPSAS